MKIWAGLAPIRDKTYLEGVPYGVWDIKDMRTHYFYTVLLGTKCKWKSLRVWVLNWEH